MKNKVMADVFEIILSFVYLVNIVYLMQVARQN